MEEANWSVLTSLLAPAPTPHTSRPMSPNTTTGVQEPSYSVFFPTPTSTVEMTISSQPTTTPHCGFPVVIHYQPREVLRFIDPATAGSDGRDTTISVFERRHTSMSINAPFHGGSVLDPCYDLYQNVCGMVYAHDLDIDPNTLPALIESIILAACRASIHNLGPFQTALEVDLAVMSDHYTEVRTVPAACAVEEMLEGCKVLVEESQKDECCAICLEEFPVGSEATQMRCSHAFHRGCIARWLERSRYCPLCRFEVVS